MAVFTAFSLSGEMLIVPSDRSTILFNLLHEFRTLIFKQSQYNVAGRENFLT